MSNSYKKDFDTSRNFDVKKVHPLSKLNYKKQIYKDFNIIKFIKSKIILFYKSFSSKSVAIVVSAEDKWQTPEFN